MQDLDVMRAGAWHDPVAIDMEARESDRRDPGDFAGRKPASHSGAQRSGHPIDALKPADRFDVESHVANAVEITTIDFATKVLAAPTLAVVMFHELWDAVSARARRRLIFLDPALCREPFELYTMDLDRCARLGLRYGVTTVPTVLVFRDGSVVARSTSAHDNDSIIALINSAS